MLNDPIDQCKIYDVHNSKHKFIILIFFIFEIASIACVILSRFRNRFSSSAHQLIFANFIPFI